MTLLSIVLAMTWLTESNVHLRAKTFYLFNIKKNLYSPEMPLIFPPSQAAESNNITSERRIADLVGENRKGSSILNLGTVPWRVLGPPFQKFILIWCDKTRRAIEKIQKEVLIYME